MAIKVLDVRRAGGRARTDDLTITNRLRYQLRHTGNRHIIITCASCSFAGRMDFEEYFATLIANLELQLLLLKVVNNMTVIPYIFTP